MPADILTTVRATAKSSDLQVEMFAFERSGSTGVELRIHLPGQNVTELDLKAEHFGELPELLAKMRADLRDARERLTKAGVP